MWIRLKRALLVLVGVLVVVLGSGGVVSALLGYYGSHLGVIAGVAACGVLLVALGLFLARIGLRGSDRDVSDTDLL